MPGVYEDEALPVEILAALFISAVLFMILMSFKHKLLVSCLWSLACLGMLVLFYVTVLVPTMK